MSASSNQEISGQTQHNPEAKQPKRCLYVQVIKPDGDMEMEEVEDWPLDQPTHNLQTYIADMYQVPVQKVKIFVEVPGSFVLSEFQVTDTGYQSPLIAKISQ